MKGAKDRSIRSSVPPRREVNVQANGTDQKEIAEGLDAIDAAAFKAELSNASTPVKVVANDGPFGRAGLNGRSDESRVGNEGVSTCRSWWAQDHLKKNHIISPEARQKSNNVTL